MTKEKETINDAGASMSEEEARARLPGLVREMAQSCPEIDLDESRITRLGKIFDQLSPTLVRQVHDRMQAETSISGDKMGMFVERYGISAAEARLLATLVEGRTVVEHAGLAGISINTARTHMRRLLDKSGAANQLDLLRKFFET